MTTVSQVWTDQKSITRQRVVEVDQEALSAGQARFKIERFALTANNVTYAATGFDIGYWKFFPTQKDGQGQVPIWGFASVSESQSDVVAAGDRFYGFFPMAQEVVMTPEARGKSAIRDGAEHRQGLPEVYNLYSRVGAADKTAEHYRALMQPLIATSFLLADWLEDNAYFGAQQVIVGSASSKTGLGLCAFLAQAKGKPVKVIGLTGAGNQDFVRELGYCDQVVPYEAVDTLDRVSSVYVDMAGNAAVKKALHAHLEGVLKHSSAVGISHWDQFAPPKDLAGPKPQFFFAPAQIAKRKEDWGPGVIEGKIAQATDLIVKDAERWLTLKPIDGLDAAMTAYGALANGSADPKVGLVVEV